MSSESTTSQSDEVQVDLPDNEPDDGVGVVPTSTGEKANLFRALCEFSLISSKVYQSLYSVKASKQSDGQLLSTIGELDRELEEWKERIPFEFRPDSEPNVQNAELLLQVVNVSFAYYNCLMTIHRMSIHHGYWTNRLSNYALQGLNVRPLNPRVYSSALLCVQAARASINLIKYIPQGDYAYLWLILYYPVSSMVTLFANVLQNPQDPRARADLKLMNVVTSFLSRICVNESTGSLKRMQTIAMEFERVATVALNKAEREMTARQKRKQEEEREKIKETGLSSGEQGNATMQQQQNHGQKRPVDALRDPSGAAAFSDQRQEASMDSTMFKDAFNPTQTFSPLLRQMMPNSPNQRGNLGEIRGMSPLFPFNTPSSNTGNSSTSNTSPQQQPTPGSLDSFFAFSGSGATPPGPGASRSGNTPSSSNNWEPGAAFQQPFLPQDLWSMPMTFEWDWAAMDNMNNEPFDDSGGKR